MALPSLTPSEDANIMQARRTLENIWHDQCTPTEQADWSDALDSFPPHDSSGRSYVVDAPTAFSQIRVTRPTQYAWSQIYGFFRFGAVPLISPGSYPHPEITFSLSRTSEAALHLYVSTTSAPGDMVGLLVFTTNPRQKGGPISKYNLRPVGKWVPDSFPRVLDLTSVMTAKWGALVAAPIGLLVLAVDLNNQLAYYNAMLETAITSP